MRRNQQRSIRLACFKAVVAVGVVFATHGVTSGQSLTLYDNFSGVSGADSPQWIEIVRAPGSVSYDGSQVVLDLTAGAAGKQAAIQASNLTFQLLRQGDQVRFTWDEELLTYNYNAWGGGMRLAENLTSAISAVDVVKQGYCTNSPVAGGRARIDVAGSNGHFTLQQFSPGRYHYDVALSIVNDGATKIGAMLRIYDHNSAFDAEPARYEAEGHFLESLAGTNTFTPSDQLHLFFWNENLVPETGAYVLDAIAFDNVYYSFTKLGGEENTRIATAVEVYWDSKTNANYKVQYSTALSGDWMDLTARLTGTGQSMSVFDSTRSTAKRFYRIVEVP